MNINKIREYMVDKVPYAAIVEINKRILDISPNNPRFAAIDADELLEIIEVKEGVEYPDELYELMHLKSAIEDESFYSIGK